MIQLWNDQETNNFYLINNETGEKQRVYKTGDFIKEFDPQLTGSVGYKGRLKLAQKPSYLPTQAKSLQKLYTYYTPKGNKFLWYSQCPRPKKMPILDHFSTTNKSFLSKTFNQREQFFTARNTKTLPPTQNSAGQSNYQSLLEPEQVKSISSIQNRDLNDHEHFKEMSHLFDSKSYDYRSFNYPQKLSFNCKSIREFEETLKEEQQQLDMFRLPEPEKQVINTKGRFPLQIRTSTDFVREDKMVAKLLFPELFKEKMVDQKQEELRRKINKLKEQEMLQRNLKNKI